MAAKVKDIVKNMHVAELQAWVVEKRVANTEKWGVVGYAKTREEAVKKAHAVVGGKSTGVRVCRTDSPYAKPEVVVGV